MSEIRSIASIKECAAKAAKTGDVKRIDLHPEHLKNKWVEEYLKAAENETINFYKEKQAHDYAKAQQMADAFKVLADMASKRDFIVISEE